jgi:hypothetical protein
LALDKSVSSVDLRLMSDLQMNAAALSKSLITSKAKGHIYVLGFW